MNPRKLLLALPAAAAALAFMAGPALADDHGHHGGGDTGHHEGGHQHGQPEPGDDHGQPEPGDDHGHHGGGHH